MLATYPTNTQLTKYNNFLGNVQSRLFNQPFEKTKQIDDKVLRTVKCNKYLTQKDFNVLKIIMHQWYLQGKKNTFSINLEKACSQLGLVSKKYIQDTNGNKLISNNQCNNHNNFYMRASSIMSFIITIENMKKNTKSSFHYIDELEMSSSSLKVKLNDKFINLFKKSKMQHAQLLFIDGEYNQKVLDFLLTEVQTKQNLVGMHKDKEFRFKNFKIQQILKYMKLTIEYSKNPDKIKRHISKSLKEIYLQFKDNMSIAIPLYKLKRNTDEYEIKDYNY